MNRRDRFLIPRRVGERHLPTFNFIHSIGSESFCVVLLTTLFGELDLNPYFCNRQNYTYESSFNKQHSEKEKQNGHLPCGFGQESKLSL